MLKRKFYNQLLAWKEQEEKMCLVVEGARQVGKTFIIDKFCRENYQNYIKINFIETPSLKSIFAGDLDIETIKKQLTASFPQEPLRKNTTVLFLDEIQACPSAITALKFLSIADEFDVIASGSLLGLAYQEVESFPVGYTDRLTMYQLDFEEFLWANGYSDEVVAMLKGYLNEDENIPEAIHNRMMQLFREYVAVGGMPRVVQKFVNTNDFAEVARIQAEIVADYEDDIAKYAKETEKSKARACFHSVPRQLAKENKKFQYKVVEAASSARKFSGSIKWLVDAGIIRVCHNVSRPEAPLEGYSIGDHFKIYLNDTGLLASMLGRDTIKNIIEGNLGIYKGALYENIIANALAQKNYPLYYFEYRGQIELDFLIENNGQTSAIEVKSGDNLRSKSLRSAVENWGVSHGLRLSSKNYNQHGEKIDSLPIYLTAFLPEA